eukprot:gene17081-biopygen782
MPVPEGFFEFQLKDGRGIYARGGSPEEAFFVSVVNYFDGSTPQRNKLPWPHLQWIQEMLLCTPTPHFRHITARIKRRGC